MKPQKKKITINKKKLLDYAIAAAIVIGIYIFTKTPHTSVLKWTIFGGSFHIGYFIGVMIVLAVIWLIFRERGTKNEKSKN